MGYFVQWRIVFHVVRRLQHLRVLSKGGSLKQLLTCCLGSFPNHKWNPMPLGKSIPNQKLIISRLDIFNFHHYISFYQKKIHIFSSELPGKFNTIRINTFESTKTNPARAPWSDNSQRWWISWTFCPPGKHGFHVDFPNERWNQHTTHFRFLFVRLGSPKTKIRSE